MQRVKHTVGAFNSIAQSKEKKQQASLGDANSAQRLQPILQIDSTRDSKAVTFQANPSQQNSSQPIKILGNTPSTLGLIQLLFCKRK